MLTLRNRSQLEAIRTIRIDEDLGTERPQSRREWHDLDHRRVPVEDSLRRDNDRGVRETGLATHLAGETGQSAQMTTSVFLLFHSRSDRADVVPADPHLFISPLAGDTRNCSN